MSQAQPHQPRQARRRRGRRGDESRRPGAAGAELQEQPPVGGRGRRARRRSAAAGDPTTARARRSSPLLPFVLGIALGYGLAGSLPHLAGVALAGLKQGQASLGGLVNPFGLGQRQVLVLGTDAVADNTDVMFTLQVKDGITRLTQVPRDTFVESDAYGVLKANALYATGGADAAKREVGRLLNTPVGNYLKVNLRAVERLADALGGVEVDVPKRMFYVDHSQGLTIDLHPGRQLLKGAALEGFLRFRHDELGDLGRMERQKLVLREVFRKLAQPGSVARVPAMLTIAGNDVRTDLSSVEMGQMLSALVGSRLSTTQLPGRVFWQNELSYWMPNSNSHYAGVESNEPAP